MALRDMIRNWYEGEFAPYENDPNDTVVIVGGRYNRHWTAKGVRILVKFWLDQVVS